MANAEQTRLALLRSAERLFASRGVEAVSMRDVATGAGQRNVSAVKYHFGDREELLERVLERHSDPMQRIFLEAIESDLACDHSDRGADYWVSLLVRTVAAKLDDDDGGADYLHICAQLVTSRTTPLTQTRSAQGPGAHALRDKLLSYGSREEASMLLLRWMLFGNMLYISLNDYLSLSKHGFKITREDFERHMVKVLLGLIGAVPGGS